MPQGLVSMGIRFFAFAAALVAMTASAAAQTGQVKIENAWARATPAGASTAAIYLTLEAPAADKLVSVATPAAREADLHTMSMEGSVMKMRALPGGIDLPAGQKVTLKPGGMHIMLSALTGPLKEGENVPLTLTFAKSGAQQISVPVAKIGAMRPPGGGTGAGDSGGMGGMKMPTGH
jgi:copper(I)-binding protein